MKPRLVSVVLCFILIASFLGCETIPEEHRGAVIGAGIGAAAGTAAGAIIGEGTGAAVLGGVLGALAGAAIGHYAYDMQRTRQETVRTYNYEESTGNVLIIEDAYTSPAVVSAGDVVQLKIVYAVLNPSPDAKTSITEVREITYNGELVGRPEVRVERTDGTFTSTVPLRLPSTAGKGVYRVRATVQSDQAKDTRVTSFTVQ